MVIALLLFGSTASAYQEIEVKNGGTLKGVTVLTGKMPEPRVYHLVLFPNIDMCAEVETDENMNRVLDDFKTSGNGMLKDVVISPINIKSENCKFTPDVNAVKQGESFKVDNLDAVMHNSQVYQKERGKILLNIPIPAEEVSDGVVNFQKNFKIFQMICGMHEFMQTWGFRIQNPYYHITGENGSFNIENIPPGDYVVNAWHYLMKIQTKKIHIAENGVVDLTFKFDGNKVIRPLYETIKSGRIKHEASVYKEKVFTDRKQREK
jgi:hypothetical protein